MKCRLLTTIFLVSFLSCATSPRTSYVMTEEDYCLASLRVCFRLVKQQEDVLAVVPGDARQVEIYQERLRLLQGQIQYCQSKAHYHKELGMSDYLMGALIGAGGSAAGGLLGWMNPLSWKADARAEDSQNLAHANFDMSRDALYNGVSIRANDFKKAGMNPLLGAGVAPNAQMAPVPSNSSGAHTGSIGDLGTAALQGLSQFAQVKNIEADTNLKNSMSGKTDTETKLGRIMLQAEQWKFDNGQYKLEQGFLKSQIDNQLAQAGLAGANAKLTEHESKVLDKQVEEIASRISLMAEQEGLIGAQKDESKQRTLLMKAQEEFQKLEPELIKQGFRTSTINTCIGTAGDLVTSLLTKFIPNAGMITEVFRSVTENGKTKTTHETRETRGSRRSPGF